MAEEVDDAGAGELGGPAAAQFAAYLPSALSYVGDTRSSTERGTLDATPGPPDRLATSRRRRAHDPAHRLPAPRRLTVLLTAGAYLLITLDALVVVTALPSIHADLGGGAGNLPWIINAYALTFAAGIITAAALGDRLGQETHLRRGARCSSASPRRRARSRRASAS